MTVSLNPDFQCRGKHTYLSKGEAKRAIRRLQTYTGKDPNPYPLKPYKCPHGDHFHFGHMNDHLKARLRRENAAGT